MNNLITTENIKIEDLIYEIRGEKVMLNSDLAKLYQCSNGTKDINKAVKRNVDRFPSDFYFQLTEKEFNSITRFQVGTLNKSGDFRGYNIKYLPYVFIEQGVAMLSSVLRTSVAEEVSVKNMRAFVSMRKYIGINNFDERISNVETKLIEHDNKIDLILDKFDNDKNHHIFFEGQIYDAYSLMMDILSPAKEEIIIIDNYLVKSYLI